MLLPDDDQQYLDQEHLLHGVPLVACNANQRRALQILTSSSRGLHWVIVAMIVLMVMEVMMVVIMMMILRNVFALSGVHKIVPWGLGPPGPLAGWKFKHGH